MGVVEAADQPAGLEHLAAAGQVSLWLSSWAKGRVPSVIVGYGLETERKFATVIAGYSLDPKSPAGRMEGGRGAPLEREQGGRCKGEWAGEGAGSRRVGGRGSRLKGAIVSEAPSTRL